MKSVVLLLVFLAVGGVLFLLTLGSEDRGIEPQSARPVPGQGRSSAVPARVDPVAIDPPARSGESAPDQVVVVAPQHEPAVEPRPEVEAEPAPFASLVLRIVGPDELPVREEPLSVSLHLLEGDRALAPRSEASHSFEERQLSFGRCVFDVLSGESYVVLVRSSSRSPVQELVSVPLASEGVEEEIVLGPRVEPVETELAFRAPCSPFETRLHVSVRCGSLLIHEEDVELTLGSSDGDAEPQLSLLLPPAAYSIRAELPEDAPPHPEIERNLGPVQREIRVEAGETRTVTLELYLAGRLELHLDVPRWIPSREQPDDPAELARLAAGGYPVSVHPASFPALDSRVSFLVPHGEELRPSGWVPYRQTCLSTPMEPGEYLVRVARQEGGHMERTVTIAPGKRTELRFESAGKSAVGDWSR